MGRVCSLMRSGRAVAENDIEFTSSVCRIDGQLHMIVGKRGMPPYIFPVDEQSLPEYTWVNGQIAPIRRAPAG